MRTFNNFFLLLCVIALLIVGYIGLRTPISFNEEVEKREVIVKNRLLKIRYAVEKFKNDSNYYAHSFQPLIKHGYLKDSMQYIPFSNGEKFSLTATQTVSKNGNNISLMECGAEITQYLKGLNENEIALLLEKKNKSGKYPGLMIGNLSSPNANAGNWE